MSAEPRSGRAGTAVRAAGLLTVVAFVGLLVYGVLAQAPESTIDDALAQQQRRPGRVAGERPWSSTRAAAQKLHPVCTAGPDFAWSSAEFARSGRQDLNLRPPGPQPESPRWSQ